MIKLKSTTFWVYSAIAFDVIDTFDDEGNYIDTEFKLNVPFGIVFYTLLALEMVMRKYGNKV